MRVRTVTLSSGFDHLVEVDSLRPGGVSQVLRWQVNASGKGVNVSRTVLRIGGQSTAYALTGVEDQRIFEAAIEREGVEARTVAVPGALRKNLTLLVADRGESASHAVGARIATAAEHHVRLLWSYLLEDTNKGDIVTLSGATPAGIPFTIWSELAAAAASIGARLVVDLQEQSLLATIGTGLVSMAKPNEEEARVLCDAPGLDCLERAACAVWQMAAMGVQDPIVTLGSKGALHLTSGRLTRSWCESSGHVLVGAGDAFVAGYSAALVDSTMGATGPVKCGLAAAACHVADTSPVDFAKRFRDLLPRVYSSPIDTLTRCQTHVSGSPTVNLVSFPSGAIGHIGRSTT